MGDFVVEEKKGSVFLNSLFTYIQVLKTFFLQIKLIRKHYHSYVTRRNTTIVNGKLKS